MWFNLNGHSAKTNNYLVSCSMSQKLTKQKFNKQFKSDSVLLVIDYGYSANKAD
jgi:SAM-dependent MidA family methyltransferase